MDEKLRGYAMSAEVYLMHFNDETEEKLYLVEYYADSGSLLKSEYYKDKAAAYAAAAEFQR